VFPAINAPNCKSRLAHEAVFLFTLRKARYTKNMKAPALAQGVVHTVPADVKRALLAHKGVLQTWNDLTPLARNEWICWITSVKKQETRNAHIIRAVESLKAGKRRPCCWPGCPHRKRTGA
jgi:uncharacterized protein YdeI (YjbR/CyaY-like superfamily)